MFKSKYLGIFDNNDKLLDYISTIDILRDCAVGYSNYRISKRKHIDTKFIESVLLDAYSISGWNRDLDFSPLALYNISGGNRLMYEHEIIMITGKYDERQVNLTYRICKKYLEIKKEVDDYYDTKD